MKKHKKYKSIDMENYFGSYVMATPRQMRQILGKPDIEDIADYSNYTRLEWNMETDDGQHFAVCDWMEFNELDEDEELEWRITGKSKEFTESIADELQILIDNQ